MAWQELSQLWLLLATYSSIPAAGESWSDNGGPGKTMGGPGKTMGACQVIPHLQSCDSTDSDSTTLLEPAGPHSQRDIELGTG